MNKNTNICSTCVRECSLRAERIHYCDTFKGADGTRILKSSKESTAVYATVYPHAGELDRV